MISSEDTPKRSVRRKVTVFAPKKLSARLVFVGAVFVGIVILVPQRFDVGPVLILLAVFISAFAAAILSSLREKGHRIARVFWTLAVTVTTGIAIFTLAQFGRALDFMSVGGNNNGASSVSSTPSSWDVITAVDFWLLLVLVVLLLWIPEAFFRIQLDMSGTGNAQRVLLGLITVLSCAVTGIFILLDHFGNGALRNVNMGPLVVGIIGTVLLVAHPYRSLVRACWQRGVAGVFSFHAHKQQWDGMVAELRKAIGRATERDMTPSRRQLN